MRLFLILVMAAVVMAWRKFRARRRAEDAQRRLVQMLIDQAAEAEVEAETSARWIVDGNVVRIPNTDQDVAQGAMLVVVLDGSVEGGRDAEAQADREISEKLDM